MTKLKKIKQELHDEDIKEMKSIFNYINDNFDLKFKEDKDRPKYRNKKRVKFLRAFTAQEKKVYIYRQLPVDYYDKNMTWLLFEHLAEESIDNVNLCNDIKILDNKISALQYQIEELQKIQKITDIQKIIQQRDYYKEKCRNFEIYGIR
tara:strand:+ start:475 stop:921 length:447 start_codon:yes stop_codon:yes gene_type:complete